jgi:hypothetical protein
MSVSVSVPPKNILILNARIDHGLSTFDKRSFSVFRHPIWWWHFPPNNLSLARSTTYFHIMQFWWKRQIGLQKYLLKKEFFFYTKICICVLFNSTSNFEIYFLSFVILSFVPEKKNISSCLCKMCVCVCVWVCVCVCVCCFFHIICCSTRFFFFWKTLKNILAGKCKHTWKERNKLFCVLTSFNFRFYFFLRFFFSYD